MRKLLTILIILLTMSVSCIATLVLLVNPNDFRVEMMKQVKKKWAINSILTEICVGMWEHN
ncbi:hypothetical protein Rin_00021530 [Candidatus Regiella insecticola 5.15]|uniref:Uncharacterized protein n=1 Tax=Candidatus Regiella insecticola 5.15 TaxID=1005043 RepID=G2H255_9ENTR|nr:hypothetical protein [Candidatus Regiella insecticola]EGY27922.1 hypothetical protein Rin_00021530 [Candidatus Regiella insecticola 5.15]